MKIEASGYDRRASVFEIESPEDHRSASVIRNGDAVPGKELNESPCSSSATSTTSSIGRNSDDVSSGRSLEGEDCGENEGQSSYNGPLDMMDALEEVLPIRRGISSFYNGKSKSFATLGDASSASIKEIVKAENAYTRKRRNLTAFNQVWDRHRSFPLSGGISKRPISSSRSTLALAVAMNNSESRSSMSEESNGSPTCMSPIFCPPLHSSATASRRCPASSPPQQSFCGWRSLSVCDLQHCNNS